MVNWMLREKHKEREKELFLQLQSCFQSNFIHCVKFPVVKLQGPLKCVVRFRS